MNHETPDPRASLERKLQVVRDHSTAVAKGFKTGLFLHGTGGVGKSFTVLRQLETLETTHQLFNSRMTAKGLFRTLQRAPDVVHVLEDMERLTKDADAQGVLRSALWSQPGHERVVTWTTATEGSEQFIFRGGLILISNRPLADLPELVALATRIEVHCLQVSDAEVEALMRDIAVAGYVRSGKVLIEPGECLEVTEYLLTECRRSGCPLDLRMQQKSFQTYLQWDSDHSVCHWKDLVTTSVREAASHFQYEADTASREERQVRRRKVLREILRQTKDTREQERLYAERTGASRADFFRRKRELDSGEFDPEDDGPPTT
jgi:hypothetical protein